MVELRQKKKQLEGQLPLNWCYERSVHKDKEVEVQLETNSWL